jgi:serine/tyrosine/threonine adenylyltransferase
LRLLSSSLRDDPTAVRALFAEPSPFDAWSARWQARLSTQAGDPTVTADEMDRVNPVYVPRNHLVEEALAAANDDDLSPLRQLLDVLAAPFDARPRLARYAVPAPSSFGPYRTFCGT